MNSNILKILGKKRSYFHRVLLQIPQFYPHVLLFIFFSELQFLNFSIKVCVWFLPVLAHSLRTPFVCPSPFSAVPSIESTPQVCVRGNTVPEYTLHLPHLRRYFSLSNIREAIV